ncbi:MAG: YciI family protein [Pseudomonadota bacterium]
MLFAVLFEDNPDKAAERPRLLPQHLAFLQAQEGRVRAAGPLTDASGAGAGGLWLVEAASQKEVEALVKADPFWPSGLRKSYRVLQWNQVYTWSSTAP